MRHTYRQPKNLVSPFRPESWVDKTSELGFSDITFHVTPDERTARLAFDRPESRNAFRPETVDELLKAFDICKTNTRLGVVLVTGNGPSPKDGGFAFCSGGDQKARGSTGYMYQDGRVDGRLHILEVQRAIRTLPKVVMALVPGWAVGGGHSLHVVCDMTLASREGAVFMQTDADVASFDGGYGSAYLARQVGQKRAREIFFLGAPYTAEEAYQMGMVNLVVDHADLEVKALEWAATINKKSPIGIRMAKFALNLVDDGLMGQQVFAGEATRLAYMTEEAKEGRDAFLEKREQDFSKFPWSY